MVFNSFSFFAFFLLVYCAYVALRSHFAQQNVLLLVASYIFYGYWDWRFPCLMGITTIVDYCCAWLMSTYPRRRNVLLVVSLVSNLGVLFVLKYFEFFQGSILDTLQLFGVQGAALLTGVLLPVGISFYTFQRMTYIIEVYKEKIEPVVPFVNFALFVSFFPLLLSGPIERATRFLPQLAKARTITTTHLEEGIWLVVWGLFKKVYVADNLATIVNPVFGNGWTGTGGEVWCALYAYAFQIYCDFSGYSDVARGISRLMGFEVMNNFNLPYLARSPSDFWRRWHIALSTWVRDYVYIPLGGGRHGMWSTGRNLLLTMLLVGLWHGAAWTFVFWGAYHGVLLVVDRVISGPKSEGMQSNIFVKCMGVIATFHLVCIGWLLFRADSLIQAFHLMQTMIAVPTMGNGAAIVFGNLVGYVWLLILVQCVQALKGEQFVLAPAPVPLKGVAYGTLFYLTIIHGGTSSSFIYFQF